MQPRLPNLAVNNAADKALQMPAPAFGARRLQLRREALVGAFELDELGCSGFA